MLKKKKFLLLAMLSAGLISACGSLPSSRQAAAPSTSTLQTTENFAPHAYRRFFFGTRPQPGGYKLGRNQPVVLEWSIPGYNTIEIEGVLGPVNQPQGSFVVYPCCNTTYRLKAYNNPGDAPAIFETLVQVEAVGGYPAIQNFMVQVPIVRTNEVVGLSWQVSGCSKVRFEGGNRFDEWECQPGQMTTAIATPVTTVYTLTIFDSLGNYLGSSPLTVNVQPW
jgi:hypothetical protein